MFSQAMTILSGWNSLDTWIVITAALAAMACAVPGVFLVVRRQSMMGDALSHAVLPGIVLAYLLVHSLTGAGLVTEDLDATWRHAAMFAGALLVGVLCAVLTEWVQKAGQMEAAAALGVVFTTLFAVGLLLVRLAADNVHIDPDCVLYGAIETVVLETVGTSGMPRAALVNAAVLAVNLGLVVVFFKELKICAFDPQLATALGIPANVLHYSSMALTAATLVAAFESVGSILVLAMLIAPAAAAHLVTDRLPRMIGLSLLVASLSALGGHALAITVPPVLFPRLGFPSVVDASTAGMTAVVAGMFLVAAILFGPRYGLLVRLVNQARLGMNIAADDILGRLYRSQETVPRAEQQFESPAVGPLLRRLAVLKLWWRGELASPKPAYQLTDLGRRRAESLVRSHRLWESYMAKHFPLPDDHLHESAERAEHFIDGPLRERLAAELDGLDQDPHGRTIPAESPTAQPPNAS